MTRADIQSWFGQQLPRSLAVCIVLCLSNVLVADDKGPIIPPASKGEQCVADTDFMRRNHMQLLTHQRDETVLRGIRDKPFSLAECVDCHVQNQADGQPIRIDAQGQFCQSCHTYAAVKMDCFGCHAAVPDQAAVIDSSSDKEVVSLPALGSTTLGATTITELATFRHGHF